MTVALWENSLFLKVFIGTNVFIKLIGKYP